MKAFSSTMESKTARSTKSYSRPCASPGRGARVVTEIDRSSDGLSATSRRDSEVLPAPDGLETTSKSPRRARSLDILHLLTKLIDRGFQLQADPGQGGGGGLRTQGIGFAHEFLCKKIQPAT